MKILKITLVGLSLGAFGCGGSDGSYSPDGRAGADGDTVSTENFAAVEPIHEFSVGGARYVVVETEQSEFLLKATAPIFVTTFPHEALLKEHGRLTMLELLQALDPSYEPHERLVDDHLRQASAYGRQDLSVQRVDFVQSPIDKNGGSDCVDYAESHLPAGAFVGAYRISDLGADEDSETTPFSRDAEALAICNPALPLVHYTFGWQYQGYSWQFFAEQQLPEDWKAVVYGGSLSQSTAKRRHHVGARDLTGNVVYFAWARHP